MDRSTTNRSVLLKLNELRREAKYTDFVFIVGDVRFPVHKIVLAVYSPVFRSLFEAGPDGEPSRESVVTDTEPDVFEEFVKFLYIGDPIPHLDRLADGLLALAEKFEVPDLNRLCANYLMESLGARNLAERRAVIDRSGVQTLKDSATTRGEL